MASIQLWQISRKNNVTKSNLRLRTKRISFTDVFWYLNVFTKENILIHQCVNPYFHLRKSMIVHCWTHDINLVRWRKLFDCTVIYFKSTFIFVGNRKKFDSLITFKQIQYEVLKVSEDSQWSMFLHDDGQSS